jgi:hypothetical protein
MQKSIERVDYLMKNLNEKKKGMLCDKCGEERESLILLLFDEIIIFICEICLENNKKKI